MSLADLAGSCPPAPVPEGVTPVEEAAAKWLEANLRGYWGWADALDDARDLLAAIDGPQPTWVDVFQAARAAGFTSKPWPRSEIYWGRRDESGAVKHERGWVMARRRAELLTVVLTGPGPIAGPWRTVSLTNPTPAEVLTAAKLVGLGGDSDA